MGDYLSSTTTAAAYVDPVIPAASIEGQSKVTAKWDESLSNEENLLRLPHNAGLLFILKV